MKLLLIGQGGREHALAWKLSQSPNTQKIYVAPGNAGTATENKCENININSCDIAKLVDFAKENAIDLTIVGPEAPLSLGIVDEFTAHGLRCFGPSKEAAQLESSKVFCKNFANKYNIPTAKCADFKDPIAAKNYLDSQTYPIVIKASGLAAGKGVVIAMNKTEANETIDAMLTQKQFGDASTQIVIEEFLSGVELSYFVLTDGINFVPFSSAQDHKRRDDGDKGPNTGGMGAYAPAPMLTNSLETKILNNIIKPTLKGMQKENTPYVGFLFAGIMIVDNEPYLIEYNCRLGDPETQAILLLLESDLLTAILTTLNHDLNHFQLSWANKAALNVVMCSKGYPDKYPTGEAIVGQFPTSDDQKVFHAGTVLKNNQLLTAGGRVMAAACVKETIAAAQQGAYEIVKELSWPSVFYRHDIGYQALKS